MQTAVCLGACSLPGLLRGLAWLVPWALLSACGGGSSSSDSNRTTSVTLTGVFQKGPYQTTASVTVQPLNASGAAEGALIPGLTVQGNLGYYQLGLVPVDATTTLDTRVSIGVTYLLSAEGAFYDEWTGQTAIGTLSAVINIAADELGTSEVVVRNVNLLTHLAAPRVRAHMAAGMSVAEALRLAREDLLQALPSAVSRNFMASARAFHALSLSDHTQPNDMENAALLSLSTLIGGFAESRGTAVSAEVANLTGDSQSQTLTDLAAYAQGINCEQLLLKGAALYALYYSEAATTLQGGAGLVRLDDLPSMIDLFDDAASPELCNPATVIDALNPAIYQLEFTGSWTTGSGENAYPDGGHFTSLIGATHSSVFSIWEEGQPASPPFALVAEQGMNDTLGTQVIAPAVADKDAGTELEAPLTMAAGGTAVTTTQFIATNRHPLVSIATRLSHSPDWFIGLDSFRLQDDEGNWQDDLAMPLHAFDAGTKEGDAFDAADAMHADSMSPGMITSVTTGPLGMTQMDMKPLAQIRFRRIPFPATPTSSQ